MLLHTDPTLSSSPHLHLLVIVQSANTICGCVCGFVSYWIRTRAGCQTVCSSYELHDGNTPVCGEAFHNCAKRLQIPKV